MENLIKAMMEQFEKINTKLETMDNRLQNIESEVQGLKEFQKVVTTEFDSIKTEMAVIKEQTENSTIDIEYLAKKTTIHDMILNRNKRN